MKAKSRKKLKNMRVDWEMYGFNMFYAQNNEVVILQSRGLPITSFVIRKKSDLYIFGNVEVPNHLDAKGGGGTDDESSATIFLEAIGKKLVKEILGVREDDKLCEDLKVRV